MPTGPMPYGSMPSGPMPSGPMPTAPMIDEFSNVMNDPRKSLLAIKVFHLKFSQKNLVNF
jgi:hypothetical protein